MTRSPVSAALILLACQASLCEGAILVTSAKSGSAFSANSTDLGQTAATSYVGVGGGSELPTQAGQLFNGVVGNADGDTADSGEVTIAAGGSLTVTFDTSVNTLGYDITGITSIYGWSTASNGRSNQGYSISITYVDDSTATLLGVNEWEPNSPASYWTQISFTNSGGGALDCDTYNLNGGGATAGTGVTATGVKAITFANFTEANAGGVTVAREFDIYGVATVPEPGAAALVALGALPLLRRRRP